MTLENLVQRGLDNLIQTIIIVVIIGASVLGPIARKLIEAFSDQKSEPSDTPRSSGRGPRIPAGRQGERSPTAPLPPVRRPAPPGRGPETAPRPPLARPYPSRPDPTARTEPRRPAAPEPRGPVKPPRRPAARPAPVARVDAPRPPTRRPPRPPPAAVPQQPRRPVKRVQGAKPRSAAVRRQAKEVEGPFGELIADWDKQIEAVAEQATEEIDEVIRAYELDPADIGYDATERRVDPLGKIDRADLRRGIILRELLGPPRALAAPEEDW